MLIKTFCFELIKLWCGMAPYLMLGMVIAGILKLLINEEFILRHLGKNRFIDVVKAAVIGVPLPVCSCGVIPLAQSLRKSGASVSATLSFMVSTPETGIDSILATYSLLGPLFAVFRPAAAFVSGILAGTVNSLVNPNSAPPVKEVEKHCCCEERHADHCCHERNRFREFFSYTFIELPADMGKWLFFGMLLGALITTFIPADFGSLFTSYPFLDFLIVLAVAIPLYVCATGSIPIAYSLMLKGFSPGAALVFLIAGPATNSVTMTFVYKELGKKAFAVYIGVISFVALFSGYLFNLLWVDFGTGPAGSVCCGEQVWPWLRYFTALILFICTLYAVTRKKTSTGKHQHLEGKCPES
ncbi:MAG: SO_0444 family Cu/Zn efflux transporter [Candidatus Wallbacteria bacterium]|nr:SO_0444 family Cu/Zn efflux transporter [Candidatus Wallbacteria bacterium]